MNLLFRGLQRAGRPADRIATIGRAASASSKHRGGRTPTPSPTWPSRTIWKCAIRCATRSSTLHKALSLELERRHPTRFVPRYSMVMFRDDIPYSGRPIERGRIQNEILAALTANRRLARGGDAPGRWTVQRGGHNQLRSRRTARPTNRCGWRQASTLRSSTTPAISVMVAAKPNLTAPPLQYWLPRQWPAARSSRCGVRGRLLAVGAAGPSSGHGNDRPARCTNTRPSTHTHQDQHRSGRQPRCDQRFKGSWVPPNHMASTATTSAASSTKTSRAPPDRSEVWIRSARKRRGPPAPPSGWRCRRGYCPPPHRYFPTRRQAATMAISGGWWR